MIRVRTEDSTGLWDNGGDEIEQERSAVASFNLCCCSIVSKSRCRNPVIKAMSQKIISKIFLSFRLSQISPKLFETRYQDVRFHFCINIQTSIKRRNGCKSDFLCEI